jgi:hypothetical protein
MQGDAFDNILVPGLSDEPLTVAIVMHPCSMRAGAQLRPKSPSRQFALTSGWVMTNGLVMST